MALSQQEKQIVEFGSKSGKSRDEILDALSKFRAERIVPEQKPTGISETLEDIAETGASVATQFGKAGEKIVETATARELTIGEKVRGVGAEAFRGSARAFGEAVIGVGKTLLPQAAEEAIATGVERIAGRVAERPEIQRLVQKYNSLSPDTKREVDNALGFVEGLGEIITFGGLSALKKPVLKTVERAVDKAAEGTKSTSKLISDATPDRIKTLFSKVPPAEKAVAVDNLTRAYQKSFIEDRPAVSNKLEKLAAKESTRKQFIDSDFLLKELVEAGGIPRVEGKLAKFDNFLVDLARRQERLAKSINPFLTTVPELTKLDDLKKVAASSLRGTTGIAAQLKPSLRELDRFFDSFEEKFGKQLDAVEVNEIRIEMNALTKSFKDEVFKQDTANAVGDATRKRIDELVPTGIVKEVNAEWGKLARIERTALALHNQTINIGVLGGQLGRYLGVLGLSTAGLSVGGPGGLVVAGIAAHFGGEVVARLLRDRQFSDAMKQVIIDNIKQDEILVKKIIAETEGANKEFLERLLLPLPEVTPIPLGPPVTPSKVEVTPAKKGEPGRDPKTGKFFKTFISD